MKMTLFVFLIVFQFGFNTSARLNYEDKQSSKSEDLVRYGYNYPNLMNIKRTAYSPLLFSVINCLVNAASQVEKIEVAQAAQICTPNIKNSEKFIAANDQQSGMAIQIDDTTVLNQNIFNQLIVPAKENFKLSLSDRSSLFWNSSLENLNRINLEKLVRFGLDTSLLGLKPEVPVL